MRNQLLKLSFCTCLLAFAACKKDSNTTPAPTDDNGGDGSTPTGQYTAVGTKTYTKGGLTLVFTNKVATFAEVERVNFTNTFFTVYPKMVSRFNAGATQKVTFVVDPGYEGVAATSNDRVSFDPDWFVQNPEDYDVVTHEVMHVVQHYPAGVPSWVTEGMADYARYKYGVNNQKGGWSLPAYSSSQNYTDSYRVTARFFLWMELHVKADVLDKLDAACRAGNYQAGIWATLTGKTITELWDQYSKDPNL